MKGTSRCLLLGFAAIAAGCGTGDTRVDPADLELRDLLGISPEAASHWDADQRASARKLLVAGLHDAPGAVQIELANGASLDTRVAQTLAALDARRVQDGGAALGMVRVRVEIDARMLTASPALAPTASTATGGAPVPQREVWLAEQWDQQGLTHLAGRGLDLMSGLAIDAGHAIGPVVVVPVPHLAVIAGYVPAAGATQPARLVINPVMLAALEPNETSVVGVDTVSVDPSTGATTRTAAAIKSGQPLGVPQTTGGVVKAVGGNPYSFYGSYEECASAQSLRCQNCLPNSNCKPVTNATDGNAECTMFGANNGKGYYEICINLALAISSVNNCTAGKAPSCARDAKAADQLATLAANDDFLTDSSCSAALDGCLADIYGAPKGTFPSPIGVDGGVMPPSQDPPRDISPSCGKGCSNNTNASPNCDCKGGNCGNSLTCSSGCAASNSQSGCGGDASGCDNTDDTTTSSGSCDDSSSTTSSSGSSCGGSNDSSTGSCSSDNSGSSCDSSSSSSSSSSCDNSCGSSSSSSSSSGCGSSGDSCGSSSSSSSGCGSSSGDSCGSSSSSSSCGSSGGGGSGCSVSKKEPSAILAVAVSAMWGLMPVPIAAFVKRRSNKKKKAKKADAEVSQ